MTPMLEHVMDEVRGSMRFRWMGIGVACAFAALGWLVVFALPDRYAATAQVFVNTRSSLTPLIQGLAPDQNVEAQINYVRQSLLQGPQLEKLAKDNGILPDSITDPRTRNKILDNFESRASITVSNAGTQGDERATAGTIYEFKYYDPDRARSLHVIEQLLNNFVEQTLGGKREGSEQAQKFLQAQIKDYEGRLSAAEDKLAQFKKKNVGLMPTDQGGFFQQLQNEVDAEKKVETQLSIAQSRRDELSKQLHSDAVLSVAGGGMVSQRVQGGGGATDTLSRIQETQAKLDSLLFKYTDQHPDVIATRQTLEELKRRRAIELDALRRGDAAAVASSGAANNPVYQSMQLELNKVDVEVAALRREMFQHQSTVAELRARMVTAPQVEAEFQQLNRDYDSNKAQYAQLLDRFQKARLGERADNAGSVRFEVVLPPTSPPTPTWPKRSLLLGLVWLGSLAAGAAAAYGMHLMKPIVTSMRSISSITSFPVIGLVGIAFPQRARQKFMADMWRFSAVAGVLVVAFVIVMVLNHAGARISLRALQAMVKS